MFGPARSVTVLEVSTREASPAEGRFVQTAIPEMSELCSVARLRGTARVNQGCDRRAESFGYGSPTLALCAEPHSPRIVGRFVWGTLPASLGFRRPYSVTRSPNQFALQFGESRKDVKEEPRHRIGVLGVEVLGDGDKTNTERNQFLNAFDGGGNAPPPSVQLPDQHRIDAASASVFEQSVQFWPRYGCAAPAGVQILIGDRPT